MKTNYSQLPSYSQGVTRGAMFDLAFFFFVKGICVSNGEETQDVFTLLANVEITTLHNH